MAESLNVVVCAPIMGADLDPIRAVDSSINVIDANATFADLNKARRSGDKAAEEAAYNRLAQDLADADVLCMMYPMLEDAAALAPKLSWLHHTQAGVSNLWSADVWKAERIAITSGRGYVRPTAIAEYALAAIMSAARGLHDGYIQKTERRLDPDDYRLRRVAGSTVGIVGLGGIGKEVARLSRALGMRVIATRRSVTSPQQDIDGADLLLPATELTRIAAESDFVVVTTALTNDTEKMLDDAFFEAATKTPLLVNISRGEVIVEDALLAAIEASRWRGAVLDVFSGELEHRPPRRELVEHPDVLLTAHISGFGAVDDSSFIDLFCENLRRYIAGAPLINLVDRERGY